MKRVNTRYRMMFADGGLKKELDKLKNSSELYMLVAQYKEISHEESRIFRLLGAEDIIKDYKQIIRYTKKQIKNTDNINELLNYKCILEQLEKELEKKINKSRGGYKADKTKKSPVFRESDWIELDCHTFSVNYQYEYKSGRKVRTVAYNNWINNFPRVQVTPRWKMYQLYGIKVNRPFMIEMEVVQKAETDVDNGIKSFLDMLVDIWNLEDDNHIVGVNIKKIGTCGDYSQGKIRFRLIQEVM